jgi:beta-1,2-mannobiose phosphorylase / 1,2-beta-oligomannan phosphorylase
MFTLERSNHNPILSPNHNHPWEAVASFNGAPIEIDGKIALLYRAMAEREKIEDPHMNLSTIGVAFSSDGEHFSNRTKLVFPTESYDKYGCEDPRVTYIDGKYYIFYTALGGYPFSEKNIKVAVAISDDLTSIREKHLVTPFNAKAMVLFPEKINGKYVVYFSLHTDAPPTYICYAELDNLDDLWSAEFWETWYQDYSTKTLALKRYDDDHVEVGSTPVKTEKGWLMLYSHIQHYGKEDQVFGIEAVLFDMDDHTKIVGRTLGPCITPNEFYEKIGMVKNITFPSGALIKDDVLHIYYGAADTYCATAKVSLARFLEYVTNDKEKKFRRFEKNPILKKRDGMSWESKGVLNPAAIDIDGTVYILYRAFSDQNISTIGLAVSKDGFTIDERLDSPIYTPRKDFEKNATPGGYAGCEDPRVVRIENDLHITYTAYDGVLPRVATSHISVDDFLARDFSKWSEPVLITPINIDNKDSVIFPEKIQDKYFIIHRAFSTICGDYVHSLDFKDDLVNSCIEVLAPRPGMWDGKKVGLATPPILTEKGYIMLYHGVSANSVYRLGAVLLDKNDPSNVLARITPPIFEPEEEYELHGFVPNVVFPTGVVVRDDVVFIYYGAADDTIGVATLPLQVLLGYFD